MGPPAPFLSCDRLQLILPNGVHWTIPAILALDWLMFNRKRKPMERSFFMRIGEQTSFVVFPDRKECESSMCAGRYQCPCLIEGISGINALHVVRVAVTKSMQ